MGVVTVTVTYECSLDSDDLLELFRNGRYDPGKTITALVTTYPAAAFVSEFGDDDVPKIVVSR